MPIKSPMKLQWFHILLALAEDDMHGFGIQRAVMDRTGGEIRLWPAMLYRSLATLADALVSVHDPVEGTFLGQDVSDLSGDYSINLAAAGEYAVRFLPPVGNRYVGDSPEALDLLNQVEKYNVLLWGNLFQG